MNEFNEIFEDKYLKRSLHDSKYKNTPGLNTDRYRKNTVRDGSRYDSKHCSRYDSENYSFSQSTLCVHHHDLQTPSRSTICMSPQQKHSSKSSLYCPRQHRDNHIIDKDVSTLPYYIVPVLYVPHKPLYEAKRLIEPHIYKAYHCKSKNQLAKNLPNSRYSPKLSNSKSLLNLYTKKNRKEFNDHYNMTRDKKCNDYYSFEYYDEYFKKYIDEKRSSSDISFCTEKSYANLSVTPKRSKFNEMSQEKETSISKDFPELFGTCSTSSSPNNARKLPRPGSCEEEPTWDSPRTVDALISTEITIKSNISAQTSFETLKQSIKLNNIERDTQGTQTLIKDIKKTVLVVPNDKFRRSAGKEPIPEEVPRDMFDSKSLKAKSSDGQLERIRTRSFVPPRFAVSRLTKSSTPNSFGPTNKASSKSVSSNRASIF